MLRKIKKLFSFLSLVLLGLILPTHFASANFVVDLLVGLSTRPFAFIIWLLAKLAVWTVELAGFLVNWVLSPNFISLSYTNPAKNPVIKTGLDVTQGFVNMLLVLVLVYIAIATILRLAGYETKKLLVTFIIVALLVNFAPVICGLIVDASNIIMNFFVQDLKADAFGAKIGAMTNDLFFEWDKPWQTIFTDMIQLLIIVGVLFALAFVLFLFTLIFILRYLVIWLLVILSPLAFVCYILPATRKYFEQWWQQFLAWSFIGVTCGFFLYLGLLMVSYVPTEITAPTTGGNTIFNSILPYFVSVVFLGLGVVFGLKTSAMGAGSVINFTKTKGKATAGWAGTKGLRAAKWTAIKAREKTPESWRKFGEKQMGARKWGEGEAGVKGFAKRAIATAVPLRYARRGFGRMLGGGIVESTQRKIQETEKSIKDTDRVPALLRRYHESIDDSERIAIMNKLIQKGDIDEAMNEEKFGSSAIRKDEAKKLIKKAEKLDSDKILRRGLPHIAGEDDPTKIKEIISKMKPEDYKNISGEALKNRQVVDNMLSSAMGGHINQLIEKHGRIAAEALEKGIAEGAGINNVEKPKDWLKNINPRLHKYLTRGAGASLIEIPEKRIIITPAPMPPSGGQPITVKTIKEEIKESKKEGLPTIGEEIRKQKGKK